MSSRMSPRASHRRHQYAILASSPGSFYCELFSYISTKCQQNVILRNRRMSLKDQKCHGNLSGWRQNGVLMAYFRICALQKRGRVFTRVGLLHDWSLFCVSISKSSNTSVHFSWSRYILLYIFTVFVFPGGLSWQHSFVDSRDHSLYWLVIKMVYFTFLWH